VRRLAYEAADSGLLSPEAAAGIRRVKGVRRIGVRTGNADQRYRLLINYVRSSVGSPLPGTIRSWPETSTAARVMREDAIPEETPVIINAVPLQLLFIDHLAPFSLLGCAQDPLFSKIARVPLLRSFDYKHRFIVN
jgi:hypothetical protein